MKRCAHGETDRYPNGRCRPCTLASNNRRRRANPEVHRRTSAEWAKANRGRINQRRAEFLVERPDRAAEIADRVAATAREWWPNNKVRHAAYQAKRRALKEGAGGNYTPEEFDELCELFGRVCLCCREEKPLTADHVVPLSKRGTNDIDNIQPLCGPCNSRKGTRSTDYRPRA